MRLLSHAENSEESVMWFNVVVATMGAELAGPSEANDSLAVFSVELVGVDIPGGGKTGPAGGAVRFERRSVESIVSVHTWFLLGLIRY